MTDVHIVHCTFVGNKQNRWVSQRHPWGPGVETNLNFFRISEMQNLPGLLFLWEVWATFLLSWNDVSTDELIGELLTLHMALSSSRWLISSDLHCWLYFLFLYRTLYQTDLNEQSEHQEGTGRGQKCRVHNKKVEWGRGGVWKKPRPPNSLPPLVIWPTCSPD